MNRLALSLAALLCASPLASAGPIDANTPVCALARQVSTDANIEACTGEAIDMRPRSYVFLATFYERSGPVIYGLDDGISGPDCIRRMERGLTLADLVVMTSADVSWLGEGNAPAVAYTPQLSRVVLSCEFLD